MIYYFVKDGIVFFFTWRTIIYLINPQLLNTLIYFCLPPLLFFWPPLSWVGGMGNLSQTRVKPAPPVVEVWSFNHWIAREVFPYLKKKKFVLAYFWLPQVLSCCTQALKLWHEGLAAPRHVESSSRTRDGTRAPCIGRWILNH